MTKKQNNLKESKTPRMKIIGKDGIAFIPSEEYAQVEVCTFPYSITIESKLHPTKRYKFDGLSKVLYSPNVYFFPDVTDVEFIRNKKTEKLTTTKVTFSDGDVVFVSVHGDDVFDERAGVEQAILKKLLSGRSREKYIMDAVNIPSKKAEEEAKKKEAAERKAAKRAKAKAKREAKVLKRKYADASILAQEIAKALK